MVKANREAGRFAWATGLVALVVLVEVTTGLLGHSMALLSDGGHAAVDVLALVLAAAGARQALRPAGGRQTYGYQRVGILAALANATLLALIVVGVVVGASLRLTHPGAPQPALMLPAAGFGILVNLLVLRLVRGERSLNARSVVLHAANDVLSGVGVLVAAAVVWLTGFALADPIVALLIAAGIVVSCLRLLRATLPVLLESAPASVDPSSVEQRLMRHQQVVGVHDLHIWQITPEQRVLSCHLELAENQLDRAEHLVGAVSTELCREFGLQHTTIQVESCHPCPPDACADQPGRLHNHPHPSRPSAG